jgi:hypothetical protein
VAQAGVKIVGEFYRGPLHGMPAYQANNSCDLPDALEPLGISQDRGESESSAS